MSPDAWAYRVLANDFGRVVDVASDGSFHVQLYARTGSPSPRDPVRVQFADRREWCRIRKPVFPVPPTCSHIDDWLVSDFDFGMSDEDVDRLFAQTHLWDLNAFTAFYGSKGMEGGVSVALREQMVEMQLPLGALSVRTALLAQPLAQYLNLTVRPRGAANRLWLVEYPLSEAMEDWATQHEFALEQMRGDETAGASCQQAERERHHG